MKGKSSLSRFASGLLGLVFVLISFGIFPQATSASDIDSPIQLAKAAITAGSTLAIQASSAASAISNSVTAFGSQALVIKGYVLDPLAWVLSKATLNSVTKSMLTWASNGFNGSPAFVTDLNLEMQKVGDTSASNFLSQLSTNGSIHSPFQNQVYQTVNNSYFSSTGSGAFFNQNPYTLNQYTSNDRAFLNGQTTQGGLNAWFAVVLNPANSPVGATQLALGELSSEVTTAQQNRQQEISYGQGVLSYRGKCPSTSGAAGVLTALTSLATKDPCLGQAIQTPGSLLKAAIEQSQGAGINTLINAHTLDEVITNGLLNIYIGITSNGGLTGFSPSAASGGYYANQGASTGTGASSSISSSLASTLSDQGTQLQTYISNWQIIQTAAQNAQSRLQSSGCTAAPNDTAAVQSALSQAATAISNGQTSLTMINKIKAELPPSTSTTDTTAQLTQASNDYQTLLASPTMPSGLDISDSTIQSSTDSNSLYTQMTQIGQGCAVTTN